MPATINGIGTTYYGKRNLRTYQGECEHCHRTVELKDYETTHWFVIVYVPLLPLGKKQVLADCPVCRRHRVTSLAEWNRIREQTIAERTKELRDHPDDPAASLKLLETLSLFNHLDQADQLAAGIQQRFDDNAEVQLAMGQWHEFRHRPQDATACYAAAYKLDPQSLPAKRAVAIEHMWTGRPQEALAMLESEPQILPAADPPLYVELGKSFQRQGQHAAALEAFGQAQRALPAYGRDKAFRKLVKASETEEPSAATLLPHVPLYHSRAVWITAAIVLLVAGAFFVNYYIATHRTLHIVNGFSVPVEVALDDAPPVSVGAGTIIPRPLAEGTHHAVVTAGGKTIADDTFEVGTGLWQRFVNSPLFLLNAGGGAVIVWEEAVYAAQPIDEGASRLEIGAPLIAFDHVDYPFRQMPPTLQVKGEQTVHKTRVDRIDLQPEQIFAVPDFMLDLDAKFDFVEHHLRVMPEAKETVQGYVENALLTQQAERTWQFLQAGLDATPVRIEWHRMAQHLAGSDPARRNALRKRYDQWLAANPKDSAVLYLAGRIEPSKHKSLDYFERAIAADPANPYPWYAKAYALRGDGDFAAAKAANERACALDPADEGFQGSLVDIRLALGELAPLETELRHGVRAGTLRFPTPSATSDRAGGRKQARCGPRSDGLVRRPLHDGRRGLFPARGQVCHVHDALP